MSFVYIYHSAATRIPVKKALGCTVWILLLALTVFVVGRL